MTRVFLRSRAEKALLSAEAHDQLRLYAAIETLRKGSFPLHTKKLGGVSYGYRTRLGRWRIVFTVRTGDIDIADIFLKKGRGDYHI